MYGLSLVTAPTEEPIGLAEAKRHLAIALDYTAHDAYIASLVTAARQYVEAACGIAVVSQTWQLTLERLPSALRGILLPKPPLSSVTYLKYYSQDGTDTTWSSANYVVSTDRNPGVLRPAYGIVWPSYRYQPDGIRVRYVCGYSSASAVPESIKHAVRLLVGNWFEQRTSEITGSITASVQHALDALLLQHRIGDEWHAYDEVCA